MRTKTLRWLSPGAVVPLALLTATLAVGLGWAGCLGNYCQTQNNCPSTGQGCVEPQCCYCCDVCDYDKGWCAMGGPCEGNGTLLYYLPAGLFNCYVDANCRYDHTKLVDRSCNPPRCEFCTGST